MAGKFFNIFNKSTLRASLQVKVKRSPGRRCIRRLVLPALLTLVLTLTIKVSNGYAVEPTEREYTIKAGFILKFTNFLKWPGNDSGDLKICLLGDDQFGDIFDIANQSGIIDRSLNLKRLNVSADLSNCHILYISPSESLQLEYILKQVRNSPVLVVGDTPGFARRGVGINFIIYNNKIRFEINQKAIERAGIRINSELLNLAISVVGGN